MSFKLRNKKALNTYLLQYGLRIEKVLIREMEILVAELQNHAKESAGYADQTANLKSSIGGVVLKDGQPVQYTGFGNEDGGTSGKQFLNEVIQQFNKGYVIVLVAGMEYATYVENNYGLNVLKKTELKLQREIPVMLSKLKLKIR